MLRTRYFLLAIGLSIVCLPAIVQAQARDKTRLVNFIGFSEDFANYVIKVNDPDVGLAFLVYETESAKAVKRFDYQQKDEKKILTQVKRKYKLKDEATVLGPKSPDGKYTVMGAQEGNQFEVFVLQKPRLGKVGQAPVLEEDGKVASSSMKECAWTQDGKRFVIILNQKIKGENNFDVDNAVPFPFSQFKVEWLHPE